MPMGIGDWISEFTILVMIMIRILKMHTPKHLFNSTTKICSSLLMMTTKFHSYHYVSG